MLWKADEKYTFVLWEVGNLGTLTHSLTHEHTAVLIYIFMNLYLVRLISNCFNSERSRCILVLKIDIGRTECSGDCENRAAAEQTYGMEKESRKKSLSEINWGTIENRYKWHTRKNKEQIYQDDLFSRFPNGTRVVDVVESDMRSVWRCAASWTIAFVF